MLATRGDILPKLVLTERETALAPDFTAWPTIGNPKPIAPEMITSFGNAGLANETQITIARNTDNAYLNLYIVLIVN